MARKETRYTVVRCNKPTPQAKEARSVPVRLLNIQYQVMLNPVVVWVTYASALLPMNPCEVNVPFVAYRAFSAHSKPMMVLFRRGVQVSGADAGLALPALHLDETRLLIALASEWLELDSEVEGIRFDSEIV